MKRVTSPAFVLLLAICILLIDGTNQTANARDYYSQRGPIYADDGGYFLIRYSPTLGINVGLAVTIDGRVAGGMTRGHIFKRYLPAGRHFIRVARNGRYYDALDMILDVRPGQNYHYIAKYSIDQVVLVPVRSFR